MVERRNLNVQLRQLGLALFLVIGFGYVVAVDARTGSWGDQGDGTYKNPILNADYPDVDVEQFGDTYYMISSKQHMSPGMVILESKDMVNWTTIGHVWDKLSWDPKYNWDRMDGYRYGVWAGDLAYHDGRWYCYQIDTTNGLYMSSASDIRGPWTQPHLMLKKTRWTDPAVSWDDAAKQAYLVCNFGRTGNKKVNEIRLFRMSWDGRKLLDNGTVIHTGLGAEPPKSIASMVDGTSFSPSGSGPIPGGRTIPPRIGVIESKWCCVQKPTASTDRTT